MGVHAARLRVSKPNGVREGRVRTDPAWLLIWARSAELSDNLGLPAHLQRGYAGKRPEGTRALPGCRRVTFWLTSVIYAPNELLEFDHADERD